MAPAPLLGLRGALKGIETVLLLFATARTVANFALWATGLWPRVPRILRAIHNATKFAAVSSATVALGAAVVVDNWKVLDEFEVCTPSTTQRATGLVATALFFLYLSSPNFFLVCSTLVGLRLLAEGSTATAFIAANMALVNDVPFKESLAGSLAYSGFHLVVVLQAAQGRHLLCGERNAAVLAAIAWIVGVYAMLQSIWRGWRLREWRL